ncbi:MAG: recombinase family protein [Anaerotignum sp.]|nr:recombinase family protein [Anaerotignum sp.]
MTQYNKITALYSRLSVGDEDRDSGESNSIVNQKAFLERYARQEKLTNIRHYIDEGKSGKSITGRPQFMEMLQAIKGGEKIDYVIVYSLSRFGRNAADAATSLQALEDYGVKLHCIKEFLDSARAIGKIM